MNALSQIWCRIQKSLFPFLEEALGPLDDKQKKLAAILEIIRIEEHLNSWWWGRGRPLKDRKAIARAFVAKMVFGLETTRKLIDMLRNVPNIRRICGWERRNDIPSESTFSRAFDEFTKSELPQTVHKAIVEEHFENKVVGHISRDSTDILGYEKATKKEKKGDHPKQKRGRPKAGEERPPKESTRLERQKGMTLDEMLSDLPKGCDFGNKKKGGRPYNWKGYKFHVDCGDGEVPISCVLTAASVHDSQAAIPLAMMSAERVTSLYDLMDAAYDAKEIWETSASLGHVAIIDANPRKKKEKVEMEPAKRLRFKERTTAERVFSIFKERFGGNSVRVRGHAKVFAHLMFGMLAMTVERLINMLL